SVWPTKERDTPVAFRRLSSTCSDVGLDANLKLTATCKRASLRSISTQLSAFVSRGWQRSNSVGPVKEINRAKTQHDGRFIGLSTVALRISARIITLFTLTALFGGRVKALKAECPLIGHHRWRQAYNARTSVPHRVLC